jgi:hypothetical protein
MINPLCRLMFTRHLLLGQLATDIIAMPLPGPAHASIIVRRAKRADDEQSHDACTEACEEVRRENGDEHGCAIEPEIA